MLLAIFNIREYEKLLYGSVLDVKRTCLKLKLNLDMKSPRNKCKYFAVFSYLDRFSFKKDKPFWTHVKKLHVFLS